MERSGRRVLLCIPTLEGGGAERQAAYLARGLADRDWDVALGVVRLGSNLDLLRGHPVRVVRLSASGNYDPRLLTALHRLVREHRPAVVHTWLLMMNVLGGVVAAAHGTPWIAAERGSSHPGGAKERLRLTVISRSDAIVANSEAGRTYLRNHVRAGVRVHVIENGIPLEDLRRVAPVEDAATGGRDESEVVLFAARFTAEKNAETLIRAVPHIVRARPHAHVVVCGDGPLRPVVMRLAGDLAVGDRVTFPGHVGDLPGRMKASRVFVSPSHHEGRPNAVLEAMAVGVPLVVSDIPAHRELVDEECAILIDPTDPADLASGVIRALSDFAATAQRVLEASRRADGHGVERMVTSYEELYVALGHRGRRLGRR